MTKDLRLNDEEIGKLYAFCPKETYDLLRRLVKYGALPDPPSIDELPSSKQRGEVEFPCGHTVAHEEDCPRCETERLQAELSILQDVHAVALDEIERLRPMAESWESYEAAQDRKSSAVETSGPGTPAYRLTWLLDELEKRFPNAHDRIMSDPAEPKYMAAIDALLARSSVEPAGERRTFTMKEAFGLAATAECPHGVQRGSCGICIPLKATAPRKTRYCDYDLCAATFDPAHSNNDH